MAKKPNDFLIKMSHAQQTSFC